MNREAASMVARLPNPPHISGTENIPLQGPAAIAANHYQRRGLWIAWPGAVITNAVAARREDNQEMHWLVTGGLRWQQWRQSGAVVPLTRFLFAAMARAYQMSAVPLDDVAGQARAVRRWLRWLRQGEVAGIFPEGLAGRGGVLGEAEDGFEPLCHLLQRANIPIVPAGVWERDRQIVLRFGQPVSGATADEVMKRIGALLPPELQPPVASR
ncbi:MAG: lysophospholipid acyltransferase family protein [Chloroflexota bacterium]